jgi:hypothetical protein
MWEQTGHTDLDDYIRNGLEVDPDLLKWAEIGLSAFEDGEAVSLDKAVEMGRLVAKTEPAKDPHSRPGNQNARKGEGNAEVNYPREKKRKGNNGNADPSRIIARLKRDQDDPKLTEETRRDCA